jgi:RHS repeat-associated protein
VGDAARLHDANGNLTADATRTFVYDYRNRLVDVLEMEGGASVARYFYDALNRRARKTVSDPARTTLYLYDGWRVCEEQSASGTTETTYVWSPTDIGGLIQFERTGAHPDGAGTFYAHQNARADVVALTDGDGQVVETYLYDDYGNPSAQSAVGNPYLFQGRRLDEETGLYYFRNRYFDPGAGRFLQRDLLWDSGNSGNQYSFAGNGLVTGRDALGLRNAPGSRPYDAVPPARSGCCTEGPGFGPFGVDLSDIDTTSCDELFTPLTDECGAPLFELPAFEPDDELRTQRPTYQWEGWTYVPLNDEERRRGRFLRQQQRAQADRQQSIRRAKAKIAKHRSEIGAIKLRPPLTEEEKMNQWITSNDADDIEALKNAIMELEAEIEGLENSVLPDLYGIVVLD